MDLVFKRYTNPFVFLDMYISSNRFEECVGFVFNQSQEEKWWQMYLATLPLNDKSYQDWKSEAQGNSYQENNNSNLSKDDVDTIVQNSQDILSGYKPPQ